MGRKKSVFTELQQVSLYRLEVEGESPYSSAALDTLARNLRRHGQSEPVLALAGSNGRHRLISGRRRLEAARLLDWKGLSAIVLPPEYVREAELLLLMRMGQAPLLDLSMALHTLRRTQGWTQAQLGMAIGKTRDFVANLLTVARIAPPVQAYLKRSFPHPPLTLRHLCFIARQPASAQMALAQQEVEARRSSALLRTGHSADIGRDATFGLRVRPLQTKGQPGYPESFQEWRRYQRRLVIDLKRVETRARLEKERLKAVQLQARLREKAFRDTINPIKKALEKELRLAKKRLL